MAAPVRTPRSTWIEAGLQAVARGGPDAVRIEPLARALGVTRGSFYWHFDDRQALLDEMLDTWERTSIDEVIERVEAESGGDPKAALRQLFALGSSRHELRTTDLAIRDWSRRDPAIAARLRRVDNRRMDYLRSLFGAFCPDEGDIEVRATLTLTLWIGSRFMAAEHGSRTRAEVIELTLTALVDDARGRDRNPGCQHVAVASEEWSDPAHVAHYLAIADAGSRRAEGESVLFDQVPRDARRVLDLGTGDGRLLARLQAVRPDIRGAGLDLSDVMLGLAAERFAGDAHVELVKHDLADPLPALGTFDVVVSSMAIHHLEHERKRTLYGEIFALLEPGGVFANFEHVASATDRLHLMFFAAIGEPLEHEDPSDRLLDVETQLRWLREHGFDDVDCYWKWLEMALLVGVKPVAPR